METNDPFQADAEEQLNERLKEAATTATLDAEQMTSIQDIRLSRALDYQATALRKDDPLEACLGSLNAGLIRVANHLEDAVEQSLAKEPATIERIQQLRPTFDAYMRVTRQVERFAQAEARLAEGRNAAKNFEGQAQNLGPAGPPLGRKAK